MSCDPSCSPRRDRRLLMNRDIYRHEKRLQRLFHRALLAVLATPLIVPLACGSSGNTRATGSGGSGGSTTTNSAGNATTASSGVAATSSSTAPSSSGMSSSTSSGSIGSSTSSSSSSTSSGESGDAGAPEDAGTDSRCAPYVVTPSPPDPCGAYVRLPCGLPAGVVLSGTCYLTLSECAMLCTGSFFNCHAVDLSCTDAGTIVGDPDGGITLDCTTCAGGGGRIPAGLSRAPMVAAPSELER